MTLTDSNADNERVSNERKSQYRNRKIYRVSQKGPLLTGNRNKTIRYHYYTSAQLNFSVFNLRCAYLAFKNSTPNIGNTSLQIQKLKVHPKQEVLKSA